MTAVAVIVAAGKGERFGDSDKVLAPLLGRLLLAYSLDAFEESSSITDIIIVAGEHTESTIGHLVSSENWSKVTRVVRGGDTRQQSTMNGVAATSLTADVILVHDAARPLIQPHQIDACVARARQHGAAILAAPVTDTIKRASAGRIAETIDRSKLWAAQTPQAFRAGMMREMVASDATNVTDEASLAEYLGYTVQIVESDATNIKITHPMDIIVAEAILRARKDQQS